MLVDDRSENYMVLNERFGFLLNLIDIELNELQTQYQYFANVYYLDVNEKELELECIQFRQYLLI